MKKASDEVWGFFGTIKAQTLSNQIGVVLVFIIMRWIRPDEVVLFIAISFNLHQPSWWISLFINIAGGR